MMQYRVCAIKSKNVMKFDVIQKHLYQRTINICDFTKNRTLNMKQFSQFIRLTFIN